MNYKVLIAAALVASLVHAETVLEPLSQPHSWNRMGNGGPDALPGICDIGVDGEMAESGEDNISIFCDGEKPSFSGLQRNFDATPYRNKRVRFSAWVMGSGIDDMGTPDHPIDSGAGLWIAVGTPTGYLINRMPDRLIEGHTSWEYRDFVVDVPNDSHLIFVGFWMQGQGQFWIRDQIFEIVPDSVPVNLTWDDRPPIGPNLSLE
jgi:hypothetical protein